MGVRDYTVAEGVVLPPDITVGPYTSVSGRVRFGTGVILGAGCRIQGTGDAGISIGDRVTIEDGAILSGNLTVGTNAIIKAGTVIKSDVPRNVVVGGNPAAILGYNSAGGMRGGPPVGNFVLPREALSRPLDIGVGKAQVWPLKHVRDLRGSLLPVEFERDLPFVPRRQFFVYGVDSDRIRGEHAHEICHQFLFAIAGRLSVIVDDGAKAIQVDLHDASIGVYIPPYLWGVQYRFEPGAVLAVYASHPYDATEYIRDYDRFLAKVKR